MHVVQDTINFNSHGTSGKFPIGRGAKKASISLIILKYQRPTCDRGKNDHIIFEALRIQNKLFFKQTSFNFRFQLQTKMNEIYSTNYG